MPYNERLHLYKKIEEKRKRPLIVYCTSSRPNASGSIASDLIPEFLKQLKDIPSTSREIDILIVSRGGDPTVAWRIISLLREKFRRIGIILPYEAYSAATLIALGGDEIIMHPSSNLGPVDPQLVGKRRVPGQPENQQETFQFSSEDLRNYLDFVRTDVGISDQEQLQSAFELICKDVGAIPIGLAKRSSQLSLTMGEKLLSLHMKDQNKVKAIAESLNKSFYHHGYPVGRAEAKAIGLPVKDPGNIEEYMWHIWEDIETEMECNNPFNPLSIVANSAQSSALFGPIQQLQLPANLPPQIMQQVLSQVLQQTSVINVDPVEYENFHATLESIYSKSEFRTKGKIFARRLPDMNIAINVVKTSGEWLYYKNPAKPEDVKETEDVKKTSEETKK